MYRNDLFTKPFKPSSGQTQQHRVKHAKQTHLLFLTAAGPPRRERAGQDDPSEADARRAATDGGGRGAGAGLARRAAQPAPRGPAQPRRISTRYAERILKRLLGDAISSSKTETVLPRQAWDEKHSGKVENEQRTTRFLNFSYVCPEPVLVKWSFLYING